MIHQRIAIAPGGLGEGFQPSLEEFFMIHGFYLPRGARGYIYRMFQPSLEEFFMIQLISMSRNRLYL